MTTCVHFLNHWLKCCPAAAAFLVKSSYIFVARSKLKALTTSTFHFLSAPSLSLLGGNGSDSCPFSQTDETWLMNVLEASGNTITTDNQRMYIICLQHQINS